MLANGRYLRNPVYSLPKVVRTSVRGCKVGNKTEEKAKTHEKIVIPPRIEREPTDVLKALASTVGTDFTAYPYHHIDDPYFYSHSSTDKKVMHLSKESGRKSAKWFFNKYPKIFNQKLSEPPIKAFIPSFPQNKSEITEDTLISAILVRNVQKGIKTYETLQEKNIAISDETQQCLLELVCFYNNDESLNKYPEEKWYLLKNPVIGFVGQWEKESFAEKLYQKMNPECPLALSTIILAYFKHNEQRSAYALYQEALVKNIPLPVSVFNFVLQYSPLLKNESDTKTHLLATLQKMVERNVKPNLGSLNSFLLALDKSEHFREKTDLALGVVDAFRTKLNIQPSLGSYSTLFSIFKSYRGNRYSVKELISNLMKEIEEKENEILHPMDFNFFRISAKVFAEYLNDVELTLRLDEMLWKNNNVKFMVADVSFIDYFENLFTILCEEKPIDFVWSMYDKYRFKFYTPKLTVYKLLIDKIMENPTPKYLSEIWDHLQKVQRSNTRPVLRRILHLVNVFEDERSLKILQDVAFTYLKKTDVEDTMEEDSASFSAVLQIFVKNDNLKSLGDTLKLIAQKVAWIHLTEEAMKAVFDFALTKNSSELLVICLKIAAQDDVEEIRDMAEKALPFLSGEDETFAKKILDEEKKKSETETPPS